MLEILERADLSGYPLPAEADPASLHLVEAMEGDTVAGYAIFSYTPETVTVYQCKAKALALLDGLARTVLFKAAMRGIPSGQFLDPDPRLLQLRLTDETGRCGDIDAVLNGCAGCGHKGT